MASQPVNLISELPPEFNDPVFAPQTVGGNKSNTSHFNLDNANVDDPEFWRRFSENPNQHFQESIMNNKQSDTNL